MEYNKVYLGDCLEEMPKILDKSIDMILCDLPYGTTACKWDTIIPFATMGAIQENYQGQRGNSFNSEPTFYKCFSYE